MSTKVSALTSATPATVDTIYLIQGGNSRKATVNALALAVQSLFTTATASTSVVTPIVVTPIVDSGSSGSLSLKTSNGQEQVRIEHNASAVNYLGLGGVSTGGQVYLIARGTDTNVPVLYGTKGTGSHQFYTNVPTGSAFQFEVLHTASATRNVTVTGSNGGVPYFDASAGDRVGVAAGSGAGIANIGGILYSSATAVGTVGAGEDTLMTYDIPANTLSVNNKGIRVTGWGKTASNANSKTWKFFFGSSGFGNLALTASIVGAWWFEAIIIRTGSSTQDVSWKLSETVGGGAALAAPKMSMQIASAISQTDTATITARFTGEATTTDDIVQEGMLVDYLS